MDGQPVWGARVAVPVGAAHEIPIVAVRVRARELATSEGLPALGNVPTAPANLDLLTPRAVHVWLPKGEAPDGAAVVVYPAGKEPKKYPLTLEEGAAVAEGSVWAATRFETVPGPYLFEVHFASGHVEVTRSGDPFHTPLLEAFCRDRQVFGYRPAPGEIAPPRIEVLSQDWDGQGERAVRVWLPRGYDTNTTRDYPILYWQDGQNIFAQSRSGRTMASWEADLSIERLIERGEVDDLIMVAIDNSDRRMSEYIAEGDKVAGSEGAASGYIALMREKIDPEIRRRYRVRPGPENAGIAGSSLGAIISLHAAWQHPGFARRVGAMSGSFLYVKEPVASIDQATSSGARRPPLLVYLDSGDGDGSANQDGFPGTLAARDALMNAGFVLGYDLHHRLAPNAGHNEAAWARRVPEMMRLLYPAGGVFHGQGALTPEQRQMAHMMVTGNWTAPKRGEWATYVLPRAMTERLVLLEPGTLADGLGTYQPLATISGSVMRPKPVQRAWRPQVELIHATRMVEAGGRKWPCVVTRRTEGGITFAEHWNMDAPATRLVLQTREDTGEVLRLLSAWGTDAEDLPATPPANLETTQ